jgi:tRNA threonylcarbamoyladenosine biosynthesis protein TsaE
MHSFTIQNLDQLPTIASQLSDIIKKKNVVAFYGSMGSGKTTLIKAICQAFGVKNTVTSPTFAIVNIYSLTDQKLIYHFDFYRLNKIEEIYDLGYEEYFYSNHYCFVEWPEIASNLITSEALKIEISVNDDLSRTVLVHD